MTISSAAFSLCAPVFEVLGLDSRARMIRIDEIRILVVTCNELAEYWANDGDRLSGGSNLVKHA